jgi:hypothetical protein
MVFNDLQKLTMIFFPKEVDPWRHEALVPSFVTCFSTAVKERGSNCREVDLWEDRVSHGQLMEWMLINMFWADRQETPESVRRNGKVLNLVHKAVSTFWLYSQTITREALDVRYGCRKGKLRYSLLFLLKHGFSCRYSMYRTLFYDISISLLKTVIKQFW